MGVRGGGGERRRGEQDHVQAATGNRGGEGGGKGRGWG